MLAEYMKLKSNLIESKLLDYVKSSNVYEKEIYDAMAYSLKAGGKRLRPIMLMAAADALGKEGDTFLPVACALEMIHTYSLIHDDLPAMDNDDYRRGKLTNHKVYGEAMAILAGDGLLTMAFEIMLLQKDVEPMVLLSTVKEIAQAAGASGMVGGQAFDLKSEGHTLSLQELEYMHGAKTGALFKAAVRAGAILAGANEEELNRLTQYAEKFGLAFQITDDILDIYGNEADIGKPVGSDIRNNKATYATLYTIDEARAKAKRTVEEAIESLVIFGDKAQILRELVLYLLKRTN